MPLWTSPSKAGDFFLGGGGGRPGSDSGRPDNRWSTRTHICRARERCGRYEEPGPAPPPHKSLHVSRTHTPDRSRVHLSCSNRLRSPLILSTPSGVLSGSVAPRRVRISTIRRPTPGTTTASRAIRGVGGKHWWGAPGCGSADIRHLRTYHIYHDPGSEYGVPPLVDGVCPGITASRIPWTPCSPV
eukprot:gene14527-biopygen580